MMPEIGGALYHMPARRPVECPICGRLFEEGFEINGVRVQGHVRGGPQCQRRAELTGSDRDVRVRRAKRKGR